MADSSLSLQKCIENLGLSLTIGELTPPDGSCFWHSIRQNMIHYSLKGQWKGQIPPDAETLRTNVVSYMCRNKEIWTSRRYNEDIQRFEDPIYDDKTFMELMVNQAQPKTWTDNNGTVVQGCCLYLGIQLNIVNTSASGGPLLPSGMGGPLQVINESSNVNPIFYVGLHSHHYQFLKLKEMEAELPLPQQHSSPAKVQRLDSVSSQHSPSPLKINKRSRIISKYLTSPKPRRHHKESHCKFCNVNATNIDLELHLNSSEDCARYYKRNFKVNSVIAILVKEFPCLFCPAVGRNWKITNHLKRSSSCFHKYLEKFEVANMKDLQKKLENLRRQTRPSRVSRKLELEKRDEKNNNKEEKKTEVDILNEFRFSTSFANVSVCVKCGANYCQSSKRINEIILTETEVTEDIKTKRRFQKYHQCQTCSSNEMTFFKSQRLECDGHHVLYSPLNTHERLHGDEDPNIDLSKNITFLLPSTIKCLESSPPSKSQYSKQSNVGMIYNINIPISKLFSVIYEYEISKYRTLKMYGDRYEGIISDENLKKLHQAEKVISDALIVSSDSWKRINFLNLMHRLDQLGAVSCVVNIQVPMDSDDILATCLVQEGMVVTVSHVGDARNEMMSHYHVHVNHKADTNCSENCVKVSLSEYIHNSGFNHSLLQTKYLSCYISSTQQKFQNLINKLVKSASSTLHAEEYHLQLFFNINNTIEIRGFIWPKFLHDVNIQLGLERHCFRSDLKEELVKRSDSIIMATCDKNALAESMNLSEEQAVEMSEFILRHQYHACDKHSNAECGFPKLPLLRSLVIEWTPNHRTCQEFNERMRSVLKEVKPDELASQTTEQWLCKVFSSGRVVADLSDDVEEKFEVNFGGKILVFSIDDRLVDFFDFYLKKYPDFPYNPVIACYEYCASTGPVSEVGGVIVRRPYLKDIFIMEYNVLLLKAFRGSVELQIRNGFGGVSKQLEVSTHSPHWSTSLELDGNITATHQEVSLAEAFTLYDKNYVRSSSSNPVEYVAASEKRKKFFKKVSCPSENSFQVAQTGMFYERQLTNIERFFIRNCSIKICLCEFVMYYEKMQAEEANDIHKMFKNQKNTVIKDSEIKSAFNKEKFLPELIFLKNQEIMKLRTSRKIISFPRCEVNSTKHKYQQVLLFSPEATEVMSESTVLDLFWLKDDPPFFDDSGDMTTIINRIKRELFPMTPLHI